MYQVARADHISNFRRKKVGHDFKRRIWRASAIREFQWAETPLDGGTSHIREFKCAISYI